MPLSPFEEFLKPKEHELIKRMEGITYQEWKKIRHVIDCRFESKTIELERQLQLDCTGL